MNRLEQEVLEKMGSIHYELFLFDFKARIKPEIWGKVKDMSLEEFNAFEINESDFSIPFNKDFRNQK